MYIIDHPAKVSIESNLCDANLDGCAFGRHSKLHSCLANDLGEALAQKQIDFVSHYKPIDRLVIDDVVA